MPLESTGDSKKASFLFYSAGVVAGAVTVV
jgi:hypothetical protein